MQAGIAYAKTALGRAFLEQPPTAGTRAQRSLLIMMNGQRTLRELMPAIKALGCRTRDVEDLVTRGLLEPVPVAPPAEAAPPVAEAAASDAFAAPAESKSLVVAKLFAVDLLTRTLPPQDMVLLEKAASVHSPRALLRWIDECWKHLAAVAGPERADRFRTQTLNFVPEHHIKTHGPGLFGDLAPGPRQTPWYSTRPFARPADPPPAQPDAA